MVGSPITIAELADDGSTQDSMAFEAEDVIQIGRHKENDVVVDDIRVSRFHASVFCDGETWHCAAFGANGINVDDSRVSYTEIHNGMKIKLVPDGPVLAFHVEDESIDEQLRGSVTVLIDEMKDGSEESMEKLWSRCFATIVRLARQRLGSASRRVSDEEDVAAKVFADLFFASQKGKLPELSDRQSLWRLLVTMTKRTAIDSVMHEKREKRGGGKVRGDSIGQFRLNDESSGGGAFDQFTSDEPHQMPSLRSRNGWTSCSALCLTTNIVKSCFIDWKAITTTKSPRR